MGGGYSPPLSLLSPPPRHAMQTSLSRLPPQLKKAKQCPFLLTVSFLSLICAPYLPPQPDHWRYSGGGDAGRQKERATFRASPQFSMGIKTNIYRSEFATSTVNNRDNLIPICLLALAEKPNNPNPPSSQEFQASAGPRLPRTAQAETEGNNRLILIRTVIYTNPRELH